MKNIVETAHETGSFKILINAIQIAGLTDTLSNANPLTVFAPTDEAFAKVPKKVLDVILSDKAKLIDILTYHVLSGKVMAADIATLDSVKTIGGGNVKITSTQGVVVNRSKVVKPDIECSNGVIHAIDSVMVLSSVVDNH